MNVEPRDELTFYRGCVASGPGTLVSAYGGYEWHRGLNQAVCATGHRAPAPKCRCGIYGYLQVEDAVNHWFSDLLDAGGSEDDLEIPIIVECRGYGLMEVGSVGVRVEYAAIEALVDVGQGVDLSPWADAFDCIVVRSNLDISPVAEGLVRNVAFGSVKVELQLDDAGGATRMFTAPRFSRMAWDLRSVQAGQRLRIVKDHDGQILAFRLIALEGGTHARG